MTDEKRGSAPSEPAQQNVTEASEQRAMVKALLGSGGDQGNPDQGFVAQAAPVAGHAPPDAVQAQANAVAPETPSGGTPTEGSEG